MDTHETDTPPARRDRRRPDIPQPVRHVLVIVGLATALAVSILLGDRTPQPLQVRLSDVSALVDAGAVERVAFDEDRRVMVLHIADDGRDAALEAAVTFASDNDLGEPVAPAEDDDMLAVASFPSEYAGTLTGQLLDAGVAVGAVPRVVPSTAKQMAIAAFPLMLVLIAVYFILKKQGTGVSKFGGGRDSAVKIPSTRFADVAGVDEAVDDMADVVAYLHDASRYASTGARAPKGVLLEGPPGTGKTLLARAIAGEAGVPFFALSGSDFVETFVGVGARRVRDLFSKARKAGKAVIFIDEIDAIGRQRSSSAGYGNDETERTLNALLVEMDGFDEGSEIIVLAATNRADMLDGALTRPGRFDRRIAIPAPDRAGRTRILEVHTRSKTLAGDVDLASFARRTPGMTGAELENLVNIAAVNAARSGFDTIGRSHLEEALQTIALGRARTSALVTERDRLITAWHEAGHTVAALLQDDADDPVTVTIVPRGPAGGVTWMSGNDRVFMTRGEAKAQLVVCLAGRAAEERLLDGDFTQGASGDLQSATDLAMKMVTQYGMTGTLSVFTGERYSAGGATGEVDAAVEALLQDALVDARQLLERHHGELTTLVEWLLEDETVDADRLALLRD